MLEFYEYNYSLLAKQLIDDYEGADSYISYIGKFYEINRKCKNVNYWLRSIIKAQNLISNNERLILDAVINYMGGDPIFAFRLLNNMAPYDFSMQAHYYHYKSLTDIFPDYPYKSFKEEFIEEKIKIAIDFINNQTCLKDDYYYAFLLLFENNKLAEIPLEKIKLEDDCVILLYRMYVGDSTKVKPLGVNQIIDFTIPLSPVKISNKASEWKQQLNKLARYYEIQKHNAFIFENRTEAFDFCDAIDVSILYDSALKVYLENRKNELINNVKTRLA